MNTLQEKLDGDAKKEEAAVEASAKQCPYCCTEIPAKAVKCPHCTADLDQSRK